jgi:hypothetical protein
VKHPGPHRGDGREYIKRETAHGPHEGEHRGEYGGGHGTEANIEEEEDMENRETEIGQDTEGDKGEDTEEGIGEDSEEDMEEDTEETWNAERLTQGEATEEDMMKTQRRT